MKKFLFLTLAFVLVFSFMTFLTGCSENNSQVTRSEAPEASPEPESQRITKESSAGPEESAQAAETDEENNQEVTVLTDNPIATIEMENGGKIVVELMPQYAPNTVNNFITLAQSGFYDGVNIHRVVPGFVIQGGDPDGTGGGGPGYAIEGEFVDNGFTQNVLSHTRGVISMARTPAPNSAGSQFFIVLDDAAIPSLDKGYAGFGMVREGMDVVDEIANVEKNAADKPNDPIIIKTITVDTKSVENWPAPKTIAE